MLNILYTIVVLMLFTFIIFLLQNKNENSTYFNKKNEIDIYDLIDYVKFEINKTMRSNLKNIGISEEVYKRQIRNRSKFMDALKKCIWGSDNDKEYVKDVIFDILKNGYFNDDNINSIIPFDNSSKMSSENKFDILLYVYKKDYGKNALTELIKKYKLDDEKLSEDNYFYSIDDNDISRVFDAEMPYLDINDKIKIISEKVYQRYKGFSVVDEIRDMNIDGLSGGVSGICSADIMSDEYEFKNIIRLPRNFDSIWIFFEGKSIHLEFLSFGSENELKRVCQNIYRYNNKGMLSEDVGYKISEMMDGSRVVVVRPDFSESWAFFVRKFKTKNMELNKLITDENSDIVINMIKYLAKGGRITAITGSQGSGKSTLLMSMIGEIYSALTLRIQEMSFELHLRRLYPNRNILSFKETASISGQMGLDIQKKTDGSVNILGEVASDEVASWMIQMAQVASLFTLFTHHAKTAEDLILSLRNSLLKCDVFRNEIIAEEQVVKVLDFDIHLKKDYEGKRYIERITEIIYVDKKLYLEKNYKNKSKDESIECFMNDVSSFLEHISDKKMYETRDIIQFVDGKYVVTNSISKNQVDDMMKFMRKNDAIEFKSFLQKNEMYKYDD